MYEFFLQNSVPISAHSSPKARRFVAAIKEIQVDVYVLQKKGDI